MNLFSSTLYYLFLIILYGIIFFIQHNASTETINIIFFLCFPLITVGFTLVYTFLQKFLVKKDEVSKDKLKEFQKYNFLTWPFGLILIFLLPNYFVTITMILLMGVLSFISTKYLNKLKLKTVTFLIYFVSQAIFLYINFLSYFFFMNLL